MAPSFRITKVIHARNTAVCAHWRALKLVIYDNTFVQWFPSTTVNCEGYETISIIHHGGDVAYIGIYVNGTMYGRLYPSSDGTPYSFSIKNYIREDGTICFGFDTNTYATLSVWLE